MNLGVEKMRYNVSGPSLDTMDTHLASRLLKATPQRYSLKVLLKGTLLKGTP
jgi:hypothetical protein